MINTKGLNSGSQLVTLACVTSIIVGNDVVAQPNLHIDFGTLDGIELSSMSAIQASQNGKKDLLLGKIGYNQLRTTLGAKKRK